VKKIILMAMLAPSIGGAAQAGDIGIASGAPTGTNYPMGEDIVRVCSTPKTQIHNVESEGFLDNIFKIYNDKNTQYGMVTADAAVYQQGIDPKMMDRIVMIFPFFSADMHLIVREDSPYNTLADLQGRRVVEGPEGSGTWVSVQVIKSLTGMTWNGQVASQKEGLNAVLTGKADAEWVVAGYPVDMLAKLPKGVRLISVTHPKLDSFKMYTRTMISSGSYPFQKKSVTTYKVDSFLATYAYKNQYQQEIGDLVTCITKNIDVLRKTGHAKWKDVDPLDINRIQWQAHPAAVAAIKRASGGK
jgi:TRAP transporter TAXI family solute receptor